MIVTLKQSFIYTVGQNSGEKLSGIVQRTKIFLLVEFMSEKSLFDVGERRNRARYSSVVGFPTTSVSRAQRSAAMG